MISEMKETLASATDQTTTQPSTKTARRSLSRVSKLTVGAYLVGAIMSGALTLVITFTGGNNLMLIITTAAFLISSILVATGIRWAPLFSLPFGLYLYYLIFTEPFVIESLANPKTDPQGGFGHYMGTITIIACLLVAFVANVGAVAQSFSRDRSKTPRWLASGMSVVAGMAIGAVLIAAVAQPAASSTGTINGVTAVHMSAAGFLQPSVTITKGSKLILVDDVASLHMLENGSWQNSTPQTVREPNAPAVNNLQVNGNQVEIGPFSIAGTYHIYCTIHQGMNLTIIVQ